MVLPVGAALLGVKLLTEMGGMGGLGGLLGGCGGCGGGCGMPGMMGPPPCAGPPGGCGCAQTEAEAECDEVVDQLEDELC